MEEENLVQGQVEIFLQLFAFTDSMAPKCVVELGIADIIHRNGQAMTLHQIAAELPAPSPDISCLFRIMRLLKRILHDWSDENCISILKQCRKAIPHFTRKVIIVDAVLQSNVEEDKWEDIKMAFDVTMMAHTSGGKERTEVEWGKLLKDGGFNRCNIISLPSFYSLKLKLFSIEY